MAQQAELFTVSGEVRDARTEAALAGLVVRAWDLDHMRAGEALGEAITDRDGAFRIGYRKGDFVRSVTEALAKTGPYLVLRVFDSDGEPLHTVRAVPVAAQNERIVVQVATGGDVPTGGGGAVGAWANALEMPEVANVTELRHRVPAFGDLGARLGAAEAERLVRFLALSRLFPTPVAAALESVGAPGPDALRTWPPVRFENALRMAGITGAALALERGRFAALCAQRPEAIPDGLALDLGDPAALGAADRQALADGGVATLDDWAARRDVLTVSTAARSLLDAHLRLRGVGFAPEVARRLIAAGFGGARALAWVSGAERIALAARLGVDDMRVGELVAAARSRLGVVESRLLETLVHAAGPLPDWLDPRGDGPEPHAGHAFSADAHARAAAAGDPDAAAGLRAWRRNRRLALYPGLALRVRGGDLSGSPNLAAFVRSELPRMRELEAVADALSRARLTGAGSAAEPLPESEWWPGMRAGLDVIRAVSDAAGGVVAARRALERGGARVALAKLDAALAGLATVERFVFRPESLWRVAGGDLESVLAGLPPEARRRRLAALADEMWRGPKRLFAGAERVTPIAGHDPESGLFTHLDGWEVVPGWRVARPQDGIGHEGRILKNPSGEDPRSLGILVQRGPHRFPDCRMTVTLRRRSPGVRAAVGEAFGLVARSRERSGYRLLLRVEAGEAASRTALVLERLDGRGGTTELARSVLPVGIDDGGEVRLVFTVSGRNVEGEVLLPSGETRAVARREDRFLGVPLHGAIGLVASETADIVFGPFWVRGADERAPPGAPFFAGRRARLPDRHRLAGEPADGWVPPTEPLLRPPGEEPEPLAGLSRDGRPLTLTFPANGDAVSLDALDRLLDACLRLLFHLRFASIPLARADAEARLGDRERALDRLRLLYDDTVLAPISPLIAPAPPGFVPTTSADERLLRLRLAAVHLQAAEAAAAMTGPDAVAGLRRAAERIVFLHDGIPADADEGRGRRVHEAALALTGALGEAAVSDDRAQVAVAVGRALAAVDPEPAEPGMPRPGAGRRRLAAIVDEAEARLGPFVPAVAPGPGAPGTAEAGRLLADIVEAGGIGPDPLASIQVGRARLLAAGMAAEADAGSPDAARRGIADAARQLWLAAGVTGHYQCLMRDGLSLWERAAFGLAACPRAEAIGLQASYEQRRSEWEERVRLGYADVAVAQGAVRDALEAYAAVLAAAGVADLEAALAADGMLPAPRGGRRPGSVSEPRVEPGREAGRLRLSKTISLAAVMPGDFQRFRDRGGRLPFRTRLAWFDRDFPGHWDRRIERVRLTLLAPDARHEELHGTLTNVGLSRVVTAPAFVAETVRRELRSVVLHRGVAAPDGTVELLPKAAGAEPFAGLGVECDWLLDIPEAANRIDFAAITDLRLTVDYTARDDDGYRRQVIERLDRRVGGERAFSMRQAFADRWRRLVAGDTAPTSDADGLRLRFETVAADFPANLGGLSVVQLTLAFVGRDGMRFDVDEVSLRYTRPNGRTGPHTVAGSAPTDGGLIGTRRPDLVGDHPWSAFVGLPVTGAWSLTLPDTPALRDRLARGDLYDIVFVIAYSGELPAWES